MYTIKHTRESLKALEDRLWREAEQSEGQAALVKAFEAGRMSMLAESYPEEDYGWSVIGPGGVDWAVQSAKQWLQDAICAPCADGEHGTVEDGVCLCCSEIGRAHV